ncbi:hypothetical protein N7517_002901 [Penicillium concentricum]|uniref:Uncharacterized protein n=1 Tax=Penicillium concentricum TaxID=293559 RepID=A0A9W9SVK3_9EURO|nr:uncharacterized protein N7517_002901 [Penicillium concentricum]KAJ5384990.1 hypothetical protein N7517_002901 [Penicillium concentricum]
MALPDPLLDSYNCPSFLRSCDAYREYLIRAEAREIMLPPYTTNSAGQVTVYHGEIFCRVPSCQRKHSKDQRDAAIQWYSSLLEAEDNANKNYDEDNGGNDKEDGDENTAVH